MDGSHFPPQSWDGIDDVVIVGGGIAGLFCALKLSPRPVTVVTALPLGVAASTQGGIAALAAGDVERRVAETIAAGAGLADERVARGILQEATGRAVELRRYGVAFDGELNSAAIVPTLATAARKTPSVRILEGYVGEQLRAEGTYVTGLVVRDRRGGLSDRLLMPARAIVLASGGIGQLYEMTTNPPEARGEGLAMAARAGALIADAEFVQFLPAADAACDDVQQADPIAAAAHYQIGGVHVDGAGRTTLDGLWACGEVACTGMHGAGCLASNTPFEALVFAAHVAEDIAGQLTGPKRSHWPPPAESEASLADEEDDKTMAHLRATMSCHVGVVRDQAGLTEALAVIERLSAEARTPRARNALIAARLIAAAALSRTESRGVHQRRDFPEARPELGVRTFMTLAAAEAATAPQTIVQRTRSG